MRAALYLILFGRSGDVELREDGTPELREDGTFELREFGTPDPNALYYAANWAAAVTANGGTYSATTYAAIQALDIDLTLAQLKGKLVYLNPRCGSNILAARTPLIAKNGPGFDTVSGSFSAWNEANGLAGTTGVADTGVNPSACGVNASDNAIGIYLLTDVVSNANYVIGDTSFVDGVCWGLTANNAGYFVLDSAAVGNTGARVQSDSSQLNGGNQGTKGFICGSRYGASSQAVFRNGVIMGTTIGGGTTPTDASTLSQTRTMKINSARGASGGDIMAKGLTPEDVSNLTWIMHTFNTALGRAVTAEGLF